MSIKEGDRVATNDGKEGVVKTMSHRLGVANVQLDDNKADGVHVTVYPLALLSKIDEPK